MSAVVDTGTVSDIDPKWAHFRNDNTTVVRHDLGSVHIFVSLYDPETGLPVFVGFSPLDPYHVLIYNYGQRLLAKITSPMAEYRGRVE